MDIEIKHWHSLAPEDALNGLGTGEAGLTRVDAEMRRRKHGSNVLAQAKGDGPLRLFWRQVNSPICWLLVAAGAMAVLLRKYSDASVVFGAVGVNAVIGFVQEYRAGEAIESLAAMSPQTASARPTAQRWLSRVLQPALW